MPPKKSARQKSRRPQPPPPASSGGRRAKGRAPVVQEPRRRGRLFWICALVLAEVLVWSVVSVVVDSETVRTVAALVVGAVLVVVLRHRIWGADWREELAASRARRPR